MAWSHDWPNKQGKKEGLDKICFFFKWLDKYIPKNYATWSCAFVCSHIWSNCSIFGFCCRFYCFISMIFRFTIAASNYTFAISRYNALYWSWKCWAKSRPWSRPFYASGNQTLHPFVKIMQSLFWCKTLRKGIE